MEPVLLPTTSEGKRQTRQTDSFQVFTYHYGLLFLVALSIVLAWRIALSMHRADVCTKKFGELDEERASATALRIFSFFVFLLCVAMHRLLLPVTEQGTNMDSLAAGSGRHNQNRLPAKAGE